MSRPSDPELTPTSYALLGLLAVRPWTTYELAKQMRRSVHWFWPRAERKLYDEPKRLVALGLASSRQVPTGRRVSTVYEITEGGRAALREWLAEESAPPQLEMEALLRVFFADSGPPAALQATIAGIAREARQAVDTMAGMAAMSAAVPTFPERAATNALSMELYVRIQEAVLEWATWAEGEVAGWPPHRVGKRPIAAGPPERGRELYAAIAARRPSPPTADGTEAGRLPSPVEDL